MSKIRILVTNDDGVEAPGLKLLTKAAKLLGRVKVLAPPYNLSGRGSGHHLSGMFDQDDESQGIYVDGMPATPVDCVRYGIAKFRPDLVLVGINNGANLGENVMCSGTVCAAAMAVTLGTKMAIALSMHKPQWNAWPAERVAALLSYLIAKNVQYKQVAFNVNLPSRCPKKITPDSFWIKWSADHKNAMPMKIFKSGEIKLSVYPGLSSMLKEKIFYSPISFQA